MPTSSRRSSGEDNSNIASSSRHGRQSSEDDFVVIPRPTIFNPRGAIHIDVSNDTDDLQETNMQIRRTKRARDLAERGVIDLSIDSDDSDEEGEGGLRGWSEGKEEPSPTPSIGRRPESNPKRSQKRRRDSSPRSDPPSKKPTPPSSTPPSSPSRSPSPPPPPPGNARHPAPAPLQSLIETEASIFIEKYAKLDHDMGVAWIILSKEDRALLKRTDLCDQDLLDLLSLLHTVAWRLTETRHRPDGIHSVKFRPHVDIRPKTIAKIRSIRKQGKRRQAYTGHRECQYCKVSPTFVGQVKTVCLSDPITRDGCFCCRANKKRNCNQRMAFDNPNFVSSALTHSTAEREAVDSWSTAMDKAIELARDIQTILYQNSVPTSLILRAGQLADLILSDDGIEDERAEWLDRRQEVGAENGTREGDSEEARLDRKLDEGRELVWSMRAVIRSETRAYNRYLLACDRVDVIIEEINSELLLQPPPLPHSPIVLLLQRIVRALKGERGIKAARGRVEVARRRLGKVREG